MGGAKTLMMEEEERGYYRVDKHVCADCLADPFLKKYVQDNAESAECSFCGKESEENIAVEFDDVMELVVAGIAFDWNDPNNEGIAYESREGGYLAPLTDTGDVLADYDVSNNGEVLEAMIDSIQNDSWVEREFYRGTEDKILMYGWLDFCRTVTHKTRYLFSEIKDDAYCDHEIDPASFLRALGGFVNSLGSNDPLIRTVTVNDKVFRVRIGGEHYNTVQNLAAPPQEFAIYSNRMSPAGIPMFYGAFDKDTAFKETHDPASKDRHVSSATFTPVRPLKLLDLCDLPEIPSVFDIDRQNLIAALRFFHGFAADIAEPVKRDGREHIEYVPTQIVTEFFRHVYTTGAGEKLDGIIYRSSKNGGKPTCVLFCENDQACGAGRPTTTRDAMLRLVNVDHRIIP